MFTPVDLETVSFRKSLHGYNVKEIKDFMDKLANDYEFLYRENRTLKEEIENLQIKLGQYQKMEESLRNAVILAQKTGEDLKKSAQIEAELIVREAIQQGEQVKVKIRGEVQAELQNLSILKNQVEIFKCQFKSFLTGLLEIADHQFDLNEVWENFHQSAAQLKQKQNQTQELANNLYKNGNTEPKIGSEKTEVEHEAESVNSDKEQVNAKPASSTHERQWD